MHKRAQEPQRDLLNARLNLVPCSRRLLAPTQAAALHSQDLSSTARCAALVAHDPSQPTLAPGHPAPPERSSPSSPCSSCSSICAATAPHRPPLINHAFVPRAHARARDSHPAQRTRTPKEERLVLEGAEGRGGPRCRRARLSSATARKKASGAGRGGVQERADGPSGRVGRVEPALVGLRGCGRGEGAVEPAC